MAITVYLHYLTGGPCDGDRSPAPRPYDELRVLKGARFHLYQTTGAAPRPVEVPELNVIRCGEQQADGEPPTLLRVDLAYVSSGDNEVYLQ